MQLRSATVRLPALLLVRYGEQLSEEEAQDGPLLSVTAAVLAGRRVVAAAMLADGRLLVVTSEDAGNPEAGRLQAEAAVAGGRHLKTLL